MSSDPHAALARYGPRAAGDVVALGNAGGFSGARLWRVTTPAGAFALRAWPAGTTADRLAFIHACLRHAAALPFVPAVVPAGGDTRVAAGGRLWDLTTWLPGRADFRDDPSPPRLAAACRAVAELHAAWAAAAPSRGPIPAVERRLAAAADWLALVRSGWRPAFPPGDPCAAPAAAAWELLPRLVPRVPAALAPWVGEVAALHPCLCDVWHDHVLFAGERVTGVIDYGAARVDHPAADLARLLGSLVGGDPARTAEGLAAYAAVQPLPTGAAELVRALDETGVVLGAANWLRWLSRDGRAFDDRPAAADRLGLLVRRMETLARPHV